MLVIGIRNGVVNIFHDRLAVFSAEDMPRRPRLATGDLAYHVLNRRVGRLPLFDKPADYAAQANQRDQLAPPILARPRYWPYDIVLHFAPAISVMR